MSCQIRNNANLDLTDLKPHIHGMYDHFHQKLGFQKPPVIVFDSDPSNQSNVLGKTAYYDPQSLEVHVYTDGRHPKDMLRSIAHELIHHQQNLEGRLDVGGYNGPGYYLENDKMRKIEQEAMLEGNAILREYEDGLKLKEMNKMSLKEWKNNELNGLLMKKFGILKEDKMPQDVLDKFKEKSGQKDSSKDSADDDGKKESDSSDDAKLANVPDQLKDSVKKKMKKEQKEEDLEEGRLNPRTTNPDKFVGHEDRYQPDRIHEEEHGDDEKIIEEEEDGLEESKDDDNRKHENLKRSIHNTLKENRAIRLRIKRK
jgi:hypothetical protein